jgi:hypothetical protein
MTEAEKADFYNPQKYDEDNFMPGEILVGVKPESDEDYDVQTLLDEDSDSQVEISSQKFTALYDVTVTDSHKDVITKEKFLDVEVKKIESLFEKRDNETLKDYTGLSEEAIINSDNKDKILLLELEDNSKQGMIDAINALKDEPGVAFAEPNYIFKDESAHQDIPNDPEFSNPSSPVYPYLWGLRKIKMPYAWAINKVSHSVKVAVLETTGVAYDHPDLADNIDLDLGYDFGSVDSDPAPPLIAYNVDAISHGTAVASVIGAVGNNGIGMTGVCQNVEIVPIKLVDDSGYDSITLDEIAVAIDYVRANNIPIINASFGNYFPYGVIPETLYESIRAYHGLFIASAGNRGDYNTDDPNNEMHYPSGLDLDNIISVAASNQDDELWEDEENATKGSSYGFQSVDLAAPGEDIAQLGVMYTPTGYLYGGGFVTDGTSLAAPHVTGVAALIKAYNPGLSPLEIKKAILDSVDVVPSLEGKVLTGGRLNA